MKKLILILFCVCCTAFGDRKPMLGVSPRWGHPLSRGLVGCWLMNEGAGSSGSTLYDLTSHQPALLVGTAGYWNWVSGPHGLALKCDNSSTVAIDFATHRLQPDAGTINVYFNSGALSSGVKYLTGFANDRLYIYRNNVRLHVRFGDSSDIDTGYDFVANTWYDLAATWNGLGNGTAKIYIDGVEITSTSYVGLNTFPTGFSLGRNVYGAGSGGIADYTFSRIYMFNRALSASEIRQLYREPFAPLRVPIIYFVPAVGGAVGQVIYINIM